jgi:CBS domain-containing protein
MKIESLIRPVITCTIHDNLERAAQLMWEHAVGCLPVIDDEGHVAGMITDRDVAMGAYTQGTPLRAIPVATAMAKHVFSVLASDDTAQIERVMSQHRIRRVPVINDQGHPIGIVSIDDLVIAALDAKLSTGEIAATYAAVAGRAPLQS